jgi:CheY-like chemotaxis protein
MHALIVEPESFVALVIQDVLAESGFESVAFAATAEEAIKAAEDRCPDLIVADVELRDGCGIEAVQSICSGRPIPVVFASQTLRDALTRLPAARGVNKPFGAAALTKAVADAIAANASD